MELEAPTVYVVDDDRDMRESLKWLLESAGYRVATFESAEMFLQLRGIVRPSCMLLDVRMPGMGGLRLLEEVAHNGPEFPIIVFTGHGNVRMAVNVIKSGAFDFIEKPATHRRILRRVREALAIDDEAYAMEARRAQYTARLQQLSEREKEVMEGMVRGDSNKVMATAMGISERTVEKHRESVMQKMGARSLATLIRMVLLKRTENAEPRPLRRITH